jgi:hypothetical protein
MLTTLRREILEDADKHGMVWSNGQTELRMRLGQHGWYNCCNRRLIRVDRGLIGWRSQVTRMRNLGWLRPISKDPGYRHMFYLEAHKLTSEGRRQLAQDRAGRLKTSECKEAQTLRACVGCPHAVGSRTPQEDPRPPALA